MSGDNWTVGERSGAVKPSIKIDKLDYLEAFSVTAKTPKEQLPTIEGWNAMRQCLLDNGLMKQKG